MRTLLLLLILSPTFLKGQTTLSGKFCSPPDMQISCYTFDNQNRFSYFFASSLIKNSGEGEYQVTEDTLILKFGDIDNKIHGFDIIKTSPCLPSEDCKIEISLIDNIKEPICCTKLKIDKKPHKLHSKYQQELDLYGRATFNIPQGNDTLFISTSFISCLPISLAIIPNKHYEIIGRMLLESENYIVNEVHRYKIIKSTNRKLILGKPSKNEEDYKFILKRRKK